MSASSMLTSFASARCNVPLRGDSPRLKVRHRQTERRDVDGQALQVRLHRLRP